MFLDRKGKKLYSDLLQSLFFDRQSNYLNYSVNLLDLFCGCGGISFGFELAGFTISAGIDNDKDSTETFKKNFKNLILELGHLM